MVSKFYSTSVFPFVDSFNRGDLRQYVVLSYPIP